MNGPPDPRPRSNGPPLVGFLALCLVSPNSLTKRQPAQYQRVVVLPYLTRDSPVVKGQPPAGSVRVLVVDDDAAFATAVLAGLAEDGTLDVVGLAKDGVEALELSKTLRPDVMLLDLEMPRMDGFQVLRTLNRRKQRPVVIVLTGLSAREDLARAERLRPDALMQKTVDVGALIPGIVLSFALGGNVAAPQRER